MVDICQHSSLAQQSGYIKSPRYPNNYPPSRTCNLTISTPYDQQVLRLYIIDMGLEGRDGDCVDSLHVFDGYKDNTVCASRSKELFVTSMENNMKISFHSSQQDPGKGFWLYYRGTVPYMV